ncbi:hypothetical protein EVAR_8395_1 [Eumeta japonica]|uniref:Uncharacterized protein n=1 Tax=Eumeta variegata TaxID=151549 RepID=A0A4C1VDF0_EUMVA|nr:hypothetical protein EVAR_8395_1 [Eumeta japonica]
MLCSEKNSYPYKTGHCIARRRKSSGISTRRRGGGRPAPELGRTPVGRTHTSNLYACSLVSLSIHRRKRACKPPECWWSPPPMGTRDSLSRLTNELPTSWVGIEYLMEEGVRKFEPLADWFICQNLSVDSSIFFRAQCVHELSVINKKLARAREGVNFPIFCLILAAKSDDIRQTLIKIQFAGCGLIAEEQIRGAKWRRKRTGKPEGERFAVLGARGRRALEHALNGRAVAANVWFSLFTVNTPSIFGLSILEQCWSIEVLLKRLSLRLGLWRPAPAPCLQTAGGSEGGYGDGTFSSTYESSKLVDKEILLARSISRVFLFAAPLVDKL